MAFGGDLCALGTPSGMGWCRQAQEGPSPQSDASLYPWCPLRVGQEPRLEEAEVWDLGPREHAIAPTVHEVAAQRLFSQDSSADL